MKNLVFIFALTIISAKSHSNCERLYKQAIKEKAVKAAVSTTAIPLLSSTAAAGGYYGPLTSTTTTTGTLGASGLATSSSTTANASVEILEKARDVINQSKVGFGKLISKMSDEIRLTLNDYSIEEATVASLIENGDKFRVFCQSKNDLYTYPAIRAYVTKLLK